MGLQTPTRNFFGHRPRRPPRKFFQVPGEGGPRPAEVGVRKIFSSSFGSPKNFWRRPPTLKSGPIRTSLGELFREVTKLGNREIKVILFQINSPVELPTGPFFRVEGCREKIFGLPNGDEKIFPTPTAAAGSKKFPKSRARAAAEAGVGKIFSSAFGGPKFFSRHPSTLKNGPVGNSTGELI